MADSSPMTIKMKDFGEVLGTRGLGERVRDQIVSSLHSSDTQIVLDFKGVQVMTQSFGDELFRKLATQISHDDVARVRVSGMSEDVLAVLRYSVSKKEPATPKS